MKRIFVFAFIGTLFYFVGCSSDDTGSTKNVLVANDFNLVVDENQEHQMVLGQLDGSASQSAVSFSLLNEDPPGALGVNLQTGELFVKDTIFFNYELYPTLHSEFRVTDGQDFVVGQIDIELRDVYEEFSHYGYFKLDTQEKVDNFGAEHPIGVKGLLIIKGPDITDLSPLISLERVTNLDLLELDCTLEGLNNLEEVQRSLRIAYNTFETLEGLNSLQFIDKHFNLHNNTNLHSIAALSNVSYIGAHCKIYENPSLHYFTGLEGLEQIGNGLEILFNAKLRNLDGLQNLNYVREGLTLYVNVHLSDYCGITSLLQSGGVLGPIFISDNLYDPTPEQIASGDCSL